MMHLTILLALVVATLAFVPDSRFMHEKRGAEIAKMAMNRQKSVSHIFAPNAKTCFNGDCTGGVYIYDVYHDKFHQFSVSYTNLVAREGMSSSDWHVFTRNGDCEEWFHGHEVAYYDEMGRTTESHSFALDQKAFDASLARSLACRAREP